MAWTLTIGAAQLRGWLSANRFAILGFAVATAYAPGLPQAAFSPRWMAMAIGLPIVSALDPRNIPESLRYVLIFSLALAAMTTTWVSPDPMTGYLELLFIAFICLAFLAGAGMDNLDNLMKGIGIGLAISAAGALFGLGLEDDRTGYTGKPVGLFYNSEIYAEFAALVFVWAIVRPKYLIAAVAAVPLAVCSSRVALLTSAIGMVYAFGPKSRWRMALVIVGLVAVAFAMLFTFGVDKMGSADQRIVLWGATILAWTPFGHGLGWFHKGHPVEEFAHSDALQVIAELGIGGLALLAIPVMAFRGKRGNNAERALMVAVCVEMAVSFPLHFPATGFLAAVVAGLLVSARSGLHVGEPHRRSQDGASVQRPNAEGFGVASPGGRISRTIPFRSVSAAGAMVCEAQAGHG
jgi:hypothetical protein